MNEADAFEDVGRRRLMVNIGSNALYFVLNVALMFWYVPFVIHHLGVGAYGIVALANSLVIYGAILATSIDSAANRFLAIDINRRDTVAANATFNTCLFLAVVACLAIAVPALVVAALFDRLFAVPAGLEFASRIAFAAVVATFLLGMIASVFGVTATITHRFDLRNLVRALTSVTRAGVVALCFGLFGGSLWYVALGFLLSGLVGLFGDMLVRRRVAPQLAVDPRLIDFGQLPSVVGLGSWVVLSEIGYLLLLHSGVFVVNATLGAEATGQLGALLFFSVILYALLEIAASVTCPMIMARYAAGDLDGLRRIATSSVKLIGIVLALPAGLICGFASPLLYLWLGPEFAGLSLVLAVLVGHLAVNLSTRPISYVLTAFNRVKVQSLATLAIGIATIPVAIVLGELAGLLGVVAAGAIMTTLRGVVVLPMQAARVLDMPLTAVWRPLAVAGANTLLVASAGLLLGSLLPVSWPSIIAASAAISLAYGAFVYAVCLDGAERQLVREAFEGALRVLHAPNVRPAAQAERGS